MKKHVNLFIFFGIGGVFFWYWVLPQLVYLKPWDIRFFFDSHDIGRYFAQSAWAVNEKKLYLDIQSEYPLFANLIMGVARWIGQNLEPLMLLVLPPQLIKFSMLMAFFWAWIFLCWICYVWIVLKITQHRMLNLWLWLSPAPLYFALYRFDIYPAVTFFLALYYIQKEKYGIGTLYLGICIALKGYALFLLPAYLLYVWHKRIRNQFQDRFRPRSARWSF